MDLEIGELDCVTLRDGTEGTIVHVWEPGVAYEFEPADHSAYEVDPVTFTVEQEDVARVTFRCPEMWRREAE